MQNLEMKKRYNYAVEFDCPELGYNKRLIKSFDIEGMKRNYDLYVSMLEVKKPNKYHIKQVKL